MGGAEQFGRIKRREIGSEPVMLALQSSPRRVNDECRQTKKHDERLYPPVVGSLRLSETPTQ